MYTRRDMSHGGTANGPTHDFALSLKASIDGDSWVGARKRAMMRGVADCAPKDRGTTSGGEVGTGALSAMPAFHSEAGSRERP
jgi:hypothetical protein